MGHQSAISSVRVQTGFMHEPGFAIRIIPFWRPSSMGSAGWNQAASPMRRANQQIWSHQKPLWPLPIAFDPLTLLDISLATYLALLDVLM